MDDRITYEDLKDARIDWGNFAWRFLTLAKRFDGFDALDLPIQAMVTADFSRSGDDAPTYVRNIGKANIESYAKTLVAGYSVHGVQS